MNTFGSPVIRNRQESEDLATDLYLDGTGKFCNGALDNLDQVYRQLTENVTDCFWELDPYLILAAISSLPAAERDFISQTGASFSLATAEVSPEAGIVMGPFSGPDYDSYQKILDLTLANTDFIVVTRENEQRVYALRSVEDNNIGYRFFRMNFYKSYYSEYFPSGKPKVKVYRVPDEWVKTVSHPEFVLGKQQDLPQTGDRMKNLVTTLSQKHRDTLYKTLYEAGNDKSSTQKAWNIIKHIIPLYDCIEGSVNHDIEQAVPACLMDALAFIPVAGLGASLSVKLGVETSIGIILGMSAAGKMGVRSLGRTVLRSVSLPTVTELRALGTATLRALDPGFELLSGASRAFAEKLVKSMARGRGTADLARRITSAGVLDRLPSAPAAALAIASLPGTEIAVPVISIGKAGVRAVYVRVNPQTGERFGERFHLVEDDTLRKRLQRIKTQGLGGHGARQAARAWASEFRPLPVDTVTPGQRDEARRMIRHFCKEICPPARTRDDALAFYYRASEGFDFRGYSFRGLNFRYSELFFPTEAGAFPPVTGCQLSGAKLDNTKFTGVRFDDIELSGVKIQHLNIIHSELTNSDLAGIKLIKAEITGTNLKNTNLSGSLMKRCKFENVDFSGSDLSGAKMELVVFNNCRFVNKDGTMPARIDDSTTISLNLHDKSLPGNRVLDDNFYHHRNRKSVLATIYDMPDSFARIKLSLAEEVADYFNKATVKVKKDHLYYSVLEFLSGDFFLQNKKVKKFIKKIAVKKFQSYNFGIIGRGDFEKIKIYESIFERGIIDPMLPGDNMAFNQVLAGLVDLSASGENQELKDYVKRLFDNYMESIRDFRLNYAVERIFGDMNGGYDLFNAEEINFVLTGFGLEGEEIRLLLSRDKFHRMRYDENFDDWRGIFLFKENESLALAQTDLKELYCEIFPVFKDLYMSHIRKGPLRKLIPLFDKIGLQGKIKTAFIDVVERNIARKDFVQTGKQMELITIFGRAMRSDSGTLELTAEHYSDIVDIYGLKEADNRKKAQTLFSLSALFTEYSSRSKFGLELDSPAALRQYSHTLLKKAWELDATVFPSQGKYEEWRDQLLGEVRDNFCCSENIARKQTEVAERDFPEIYRSIVSENLRA